MKRFVLLALFIIAQVSHGYSIITLKPVNWKTVKSVDVFVAGYGKELGLQFLYSAIARAQRHDEIYPDSRAQVILWAKEWNKSKDAQAIQSRGHKLLKVTRTGLSGKVIANQLLKFPAISSVHFLSHNAAFAGAAVQKGVRIGSKKFPWKKIAKKMTKDAYVFLHGCNTGFVIAPAISRIIRRPVMGSMTSTDFQEVFADGSFYHNNSGVGQYPAGMKKVKTSGNLFSRSFSCWKGYCHRMMPNEHTYRGDFGSYKVGLPYYQGFCNYKNLLGSAKSCKAGIAHAIHGSVSMDAKTWQEKVEDYMCPRMAKAEVHENCKKVLRGESNTRIFRGKLMKCSRQYCSADIKKGKKYKYFDGQDAGSAQLRADYQFFMSLEEYLQ